MNVINISNVSYKVDDKLILDDISFDIDNKSIIGIVGGNGSGKSTLIKILSGLIDYEGYININGYVVDRYNINEIRRNMAVVMDDINNLYKGETVFDELIFNMENLRYSVDEINKEVAYISNLFGIRDMINVSVKYLSNSKRQLLQIASALVTHPGIILLDDCFHQLSISDKRLVISILKKYRKEWNSVIILATHDMNIAMECDKLVLLDKGSIVSEGSPASIFKDKKICKRCGLEIPFIPHLSLKLMDKKIVNHVYLDRIKLCDDIWK